MESSLTGTVTVNATLASPVFALNDYGSTSFATVPGSFPDEPFLIRGPGGVLAQTTQAINSSFQGRDDAGAVQQDRLELLPFEAESGRSRRDHDRRAGRAGA